MSEAENHGPLQAQLLLLFRTTLEVQESACSCKGLLFPALIKLDLIHALLPSLLFLSFHYTTSCKMWTSACSQRSALTVPAPTLKAPTCVPVTRAIAPHRTIGTVKVRLCSHFPLHCMSRIEWPALKMDCIPMLLVFFFHWSPWSIFGSFLWVSPEWVFINVTCLEHCMWYA